MKLHLGCGGSYLKGYINIDKPGNGYSLRIQKNIDLAADITKLRYRAGSIEEVRLHHVFEHFSRPCAAALVASWSSWLKIGGRLRIEVPEFDQTAFTILNPLATQRQKKKALRHIFGSQEEVWAVHWEGWSAKRMKDFLQLFGFKVDKITVIKYLGLYNIDVIATKKRRISQKEFRQITEIYLSDFLTDSSVSEKRVLSIWLRLFDQQLKMTWAK